MGEKADPPNRKRLNQREKTAPAEDGSALAGNKVASRAKRVSRTKSGKGKGSKRREVFVESVPPAMVAEVFEVAGADDDVIVSSIPPPPERPHARQPRPLSLPPAPHPPRPLSLPPAPHRARPLAPPPVGTDALELEADDLEVLEPSNSNPELGVALLTPLPTAGRASQAWSKPVYRAWLAVGGLAVVSGIVLGVRLGGAEQHAKTRSEAPRVQVTNPKPTNAPPLVEVGKGATESTGATEPAPSGASAKVDGLGATPNDTSTAPEDSSVSSVVNTAPEDSSLSSVVSTAPDGSAVMPNDTRAPDVASPVAPAVTSSNAASPTSAANAHAPGLATSAPDGTPFDTQAASAAITAAFARAASCRGPNDPSGSVTATLTYAPSGRVTTATVSGVFAGTAIGGCIASALHGARVPAFSGERLTVRRTVELH
jgi:hypothetical protein